MYTEFQIASMNASHVILLTKEQNDELLKNSDPYQRLVLKAMGKTVNALGMELVEYSEYGNGQYTNFDNIVIEFDECSGDEFRAKYGYSKYPIDAYYNVKFPDDVYKKTMNFF